MNYRSHFIKILCGVDKKNLSENKSKNAKTPLPTHFEIDIFSVEMFSKDKTLFQNSYTFLYILLIQPFSNPTNRKNLIKCRFEIIIIKILN